MILCDWTCIGTHGGDEIARSSLLFSLEVERPQTVGQIVNNCCFRSSTKKQLSYKPAVVKRAQVLMLYQPYRLDSLMSAPEIVS